MKIHRLSAVFGRLQGETLVLTDGLNILQAPNESGKSTWCALLTAMLYGVSSRERDRAGVLAEKNRYAPWDGAAMSGRMDCATRFGDVTLLRETRRQNAPMGTFSALRSGTAEPIPELSAGNCGETLLGVSREVFERSAMIRQSGLGITPQRRAGAPHPLPGHHRGGRQLLHGGQRRPSPPAEPPEAQPHRPHPGAGGGAGRAPPEAGGPGGPAPAALRGRGSAPAAGGLPAPGGAGPAGCPALRRHPAAQGPGCPPGAGGRAGHRPGRPPLPGGGRASAGERRHCPAPGRPRESRDRPAAAQQGPGGPGRGHEGRPSGGAGGE